MLSTKQEEVITEYCNVIFSSGADTEEFFYRPGLKDGLNIKPDFRRFSQNLVL